MPVFHPNSIQFRSRQPAQITQAFNRFQNGFTLIEMMVVTAIIALLAGTVLMSVNTVNNRQLHSHADKMAHWLRWVQESSEFSGLSYGVALYNENLVVVVPYTGRWFRVMDFNPWKRPTGVNMRTPAIVSEPDAAPPQTRITQVDALSIQPFMVFNHTGFITPQDKIVLQRGNEKIAIAWSDTNTIAVELQNNPSGS